MDLNPIRYLRRRRRLRQAVEEEMFYLRRAFGDRAYEAAVEKLARQDLTHWGRDIVKGAARQLKSAAPPKTPH